MQQPKHIPQELISTTKKKVPQSISWIATVNNPGSGLEDYKSAATTAGATAFRAQLEKGECGTLHMQAAIQFPNKVSSAMLRRIFGNAHWNSPSSNFAAAWEYCGKEETRIEGPVQYGAPKVKKEQGRKAIAVRNRELINMGAEEAVAQGILPLGQYVKTKQAIDLYRMSTRPIASLDKLDNYWFMGPPGTGKSLAARKRWPTLFNKSCSKWWDGYKDEPTVLIDDLDLTTNGLGHYIKIWADHYPFNC